MIKKRKVAVGMALNILVLSVLVYAAVADYLILQDIGSYEFITQTKNPLTKQMKTISGYTERSGPGILGGAKHFSLDHPDITYETEYESDVADLGVEVQVTQHAGSDSDRWLLHEVDRDFRNYYGLPGDSYAMRTIDGQTIMASGSGGWTYRWLSGNKVIHIEYTDLQLTKPEPLQVVKAYLAKHPSSLAPMTSLDLRTSENKTKWIKDEMDRRLWLGDKWFLQIQTGKVEMSRVIKEAVDHMNVFLDYRQKYFGMNAQEEKKALSGFQQTQDGTAIKKKLAEYKTWWEANKGRAISLQ